MSTEKYMVERARKLPLGKCYTNTGWQEMGMATVVITRERKDGNFVVCCFVVDTFCLGVKDVLCVTDASAETLETILEGISDCAEISYAEAHNLVLGAVEFAEEAGIQPYKDFRFAQYILEEDSDDIPLISYEYGKDGKYYLLLGSTGKEKLLIPTLEKKLGDKFEYLLPDFF